MTPSISWFSSTPAEIARVKKSKISFEIRESKKGGCN